MVLYPSIAVAKQAIGNKLKNTGYRMDSKSWQSIKNTVSMWEALNINFSLPIPETIHELQEDALPNLPWAEEHFLERVSGQPLNPPPSHVHWPFGSKVKTFAAQGKFSHTYPERIWPKGEGREGIRFKYGDLKDVVNLLLKEPETRQGYLPLWFPEDTGVVHGERVPCTLGYHFIIRHGFIHCNYYMRSCDYFRHFTDDIYMAARLTQWVRYKVNPDLKMGKLSMYITSLHIFFNELSKLK